MELQSKVWGRARKKGGKKNKISFRRANFFVTNRDCLGVKIIFDAINFMIYFFGLLQKTGQIPVEFQDGETNSVEKS